MSARPHRFSLCENLQAFSSDVAVLNSGKLTAFQRLNTYGDKIALILQCRTLKIFTTLEISNGGTHSLGNGKETAVLDLTLKKVFQ